MDELMTERQFRALAKVSGIGEHSRSFKAAKLIFTQGKRISEAAAEAEVVISVAGHAKNKMLGVLARLPGRIALLEEAMGK